MIERVKKCADEGKGRQNRQAAPMEYQSQPECNINKANVFDAAVGEKAFERVLIQRIENAQQGGYDAGAENQISPPGLGRSQDVECEPHKSVNGCLQHHG